MKTITTNNRTLLFVEVPEDARGFFVDEDQDLCYMSGKKSRNCIGLLDFEDAGYAFFIATTDTVTEGQAAKLVKNNGMGCYDNHKGKPDEIYTCTTALESFATFLQHHSITGRHAIIEVLH